MIAATLLFASVVATPHYEVGPVVTLTLRAGDRGVVCSADVPKEANALPQANQARDIQHLVNTYRDTEITLSFDSSVPREARNAIRAGANIWANHLLIEVPISINIEWGELDGNAIGLAAVPLYCNSQRCDPSSLANQLAGRDIDPDRPDFTVTFESEHSWHYALDGRPPNGKTDLVDVMLHEVAHGLGFVSTTSVTQEGENGESTTGRYYESSSGARPYFSRFLWTWTHGWLYDRNKIENPSPELGEALTGIKLYWGGSNWSNSRGEPMRSIRANKGGAIMISAPSWENASHLDGDSHPRTIMGSFSGPTAMHRPDEILLGMLYDMGWELKERAVDPLDVMRCLEGR